MLRKKINRTQFRQGDVLVEKVSFNPKEQLHKVIPREEGRIVLAHGESTGHAHAIADADAELIELETGERFLVTARGVSLRHEEHAAVELPPGSYHVVRQREYAPVLEDDEWEDDAEDTRYVAD